MLHATYRGKTRLPQQHYATARNFGGVRRTQEDEITSTVFGPLALMPQETSYRFWSRFVDEVPDNTAGWRVTTELWPRTGTIEPDLRATLEHSSGERRVIVVEVKWNAPLHEGQLHDQWDQSFGSSECASRWHVFIGKSIFQATSKEQRHSRLIPYTWLDFVDALSSERLTGSDVLLKQWAQLVVAFLHACGIQRFRGFDHLVLEGCTKGLQADHGRIFWEGWKGWENFSDVPSVSSCNLSTSLFYDEGAAA